MHASLLAQGSDEVGTARCTFGLDKSFKKRVATVIKMDAEKQWVVDFRRSHTLLHHCRQLLMVTDKHKPVNRQAILVFASMGGKQADKVGLENLA